MKVNKNYIEINKVRYYSCIPIQITSKELKKRINSIDEGTIIYITDLNGLAKISKYNTLDISFTITKKDKNITPIHNQMYYDEFGWIYRYDAFLYYYDPVKFILNPNETKHDIYVLQIPNLATNNINNTNKNNEDGEN